MSREQHILAWTLLIALFLTVLYVLSGMLLPFVAGMALAYVLDPMVDRLVRLGLSRTTATVVVTLGIVLALVSAVGVIVPLLVSQIGDFLGRAPGYVDALWIKLEPYVATLMAHLTPEQLAQIKAAAGEKAVGFVAILGNLLSGVASRGAALISTLSVILITPVVAFYLLRDWDHLVTKVDGWLPRASADSVRKLVNEIDRTLAGFARGQATICLILAIYYASGLTLIGLDLGLVVGMGAGLASFIPYVGAISGLLTSLGLALAQFDSSGPILAVVGVFGIGQVLEGYILTPKLVGEKVGLHAVWVIFALMAGGSLFGFTGMLLAIPVAAVIGVVLRFSLKSYLNSPLYAAKKK